MELRSLFANIFTKKPQVPALKPAKLLNTYTNVYVPWKGRAYEDSTVRTCIDTICRHLGKLHGQHVIRDAKGRIKPSKDKLNYLLAVRPNWLMTASEFLEKIVAQYLCYNNLFVFVQRDDRGKIQALWPLDFSSVELFEDNRGYFYARFNFGTGERTVVPYEELIHVRRQYNTDEVFGDPEGNVLKADLDLLAATKAAIVNAVQNFSSLRGIINWNATLRPEDQDSIFKRFVDKFASSKNGSGIGMLDNRGTFQQLTTEIKTFDKGQMEYARDNIYKYFGLSDKIIQGRYTEEEYQAFYESVLEPVAIKLGQEFTDKLFSDKERGHGNEVLFETNRLNYMSVASKVKVCSQMIPAGAMKRNELREMFGYAGLEGDEGEEIVVSLNFVKSTDQSKYQVGESPKPAKGGDDDAELGD